MIWINQSIKIYILSFIRLYNISSKDIHIYLIFKISINSDDYLTATHNKKQIILFNKFYKRNYAVVYIICKFNKFK